MGTILKFNDWKAHHLFEQVVTDYDQSYDYKKEKGVYYTKKKGTSSWVEASGTAKTAVANKVFKDTSTGPQAPVSKTTASSPVKQTQTPTGLPFKTEAEGNAFRKWVNTTNPDWAKKNKLDPSGSFNNSYIANAWKVWGSAWTAKNKANSTKVTKPTVPEKPKDSSIGSTFKSWARKLVPNVAQYFYPRDLKNQDFTKDQLKLLGTTIKNAIKRTKKVTYGATEYKDYGIEVDTVLNKRGQVASELKGLLKSVGLDKFTMSTTLGRFTYKKKKDGSYEIEDNYDFSKQYDISKKDLDWDNTSWFEKVDKIREINPEIGVYGAIRHIGYLEHPDEVSSAEPPKIKLVIPKEYVA